MTLRCAPLLIASLFLMFPLTARAQGAGSVELGMDAGLGMSFLEKTDNLLSVSIPRANVRVAPFVGEMTQIEPSVSLQVLSQGDDSITQLAVGFHVMQNFSATEKSLSFFKAGLLFDVIDVGDESVSQAAVGVGGGVRSLGSSGLAARVEAEFARYFESGETVGYWQLNLKLGVSFFTPGAKRTGEDS